ncbi:MAG: PIG-L family deacetylase [Nanoarchaeota archaeon]|nr:PIG-L family deacetylase [Nanoarchaeota archaeon]
MGKKKSERSILVICAHSDDQIFGPGGTMAKYAKEGREVYTVIFTFGALSHPHFKPEVIKKTRVLEAQKADKVIGGKEVRFMGFKEGSIVADFKERDGRKKLASLIRKYNPDKIFTHSADDPLGDHRAVNKCVLETFDHMKYNARVYSFEVWNLFSLKKHDSPKMVVDISDTFNKKITALKCFKSQINVFSYAVGNNLLFLSVYVRAFMNGIKNNCRFAETFWLER